MRSYKISPEQKTTCDGSKGSGLLQPSTQLKERELHLVVVVCNPFFLYCWD